VLRVLLQADAATAPTVFVRVGASAYLPLPCPRPEVEALVQLKLMGLLRGFPHFVEYFRERSFDCLALVHGPANATHLVCYGARGIAALCTRIPPAALTPIAVAPPPLLQPDRRGIQLQQQHCSTPMQGGRVAVRSNRPPAAPATVLKNCTRKWKAAPAACPGPRIELLSTPRCTTHRRHWHRHRQRHWHPAPPPSTILNNTCRAASDHVGARAAEVVTGGGAAGARCWRRNTEDGICGRGTAVYTRGHGERVM